MQIYNKYIIRHLVIPLILITCTLTAIVWTIRSMRFINLIVNNGLGIIDFLYLSSLLAPLFIMIILPVALFISVTHCYNKLITDSELIVFSSAGLSNFSLIKPGLIVAICTSFICYIITLYLIPVAYTEFKDAQFFFRNNSTLSMIQEGVFNNPTKNLTVYVEKIKDDGTLQGILVHQRQKNKPITLFAEEGKLYTNQNNIYLDVSSGRQEIDHGEGNLEILYFDHYSMDLTNLNEQLDNRKKETEEMFLTELLFPDENLSREKKSELLAEAHYKLTWPLNCIILTLISLAALLSGQFNRKGQGIKILTASATSIFFIGFSLILKNLTASNYSLAPLIYINLLIAGCTCIYILKNPETFPAIINKLANYKNKK